MTREEKKQRNIELRQIAREEKRQQRQEAKAWAKMEKKLREKDALIVDDLIGEDLFGSHKIETT